MLCSFICAIVCFLHGIFTWFCWFFTCCCFYMLICQGYSPVHSICCFPCCHHLDEANFSFHGSCRESLLVLQKDMVVLRPRASFLYKGVFSFHQHIVRSSVYPNLGHHKEIPSIVWVWYSLQVFLSLTFSLKWLTTSLSFLRAPMGVSLPLPPPRWFRYLIIKPIGLRIRFQLFLSMDNLLISIWFLGLSALPICFPRLKGCHLVFHSCIPKFLPGVCLVLCWCKLRPYVTSSSSLSCKEPSFFWVALWAC